MTMTMTCDETMLPELDAPILVIKEPWISMILNGRKSVEIRGTACAKVKGTRVYFSKSGSGKIYGYAEFAGCEGPLDISEWDNLRECHCVTLKEVGILPYTRTYGWKFENARWLSEEIPYYIRRGSIGWRKYQPKTGLVKKNE